MRKKRSMKVAMYEVKDDLDLKKKFFKAFGIRRYAYTFSYEFYNNVNETWETQFDTLYHKSQVVEVCNACKKVGHYERNFKMLSVKRYLPALDARVILELIKIIIEKKKDFGVSTYFGYRAKCQFEWECYREEGEEQASLEYAIVSLCITIKDEIKKEVRGLFDE